MLSTNDLIDRVKTQPDQIEFSEVIQCIDGNHQYTPCAFTNGETNNAAGTNEGSCKVLAFGQMHGLSVQQTLALFAQHYRDDVLPNPQGTDHANIRNFMKSGWAGVVFDGIALK